MYAITELKKSLEAARKQIEKELAHVDSPEFKQEFARLHSGTLGDDSAYKAGWLQSTAQQAARNMEYMERSLASAIPEIELFERVSNFFYNMDIGEQEFRWLALAENTDRYRDEWNQLRKVVSKIAGEIEESERERERENTEKALGAAGFVHVERDDFEGWERTIPSTGASQDNTGFVEHVTIEHTRSAPGLRHPDVYKWDLERSGRLIDSGKSEQFDRLLKALNIEQPPVAGDRR